MQWTGIINLTICGMLRFK